jgi:hypothetical protein
MAFPNDISRICDQLAKLASSASDFVGSKKAASRALARETHTFEKAAADGAAATATLYTATPGFRARADGRLLGAYFIPHGALVADNVNNATLTVNKSDGLGGAATAMASKITNAAGTGNLTAGVVEKLDSAALAATQFTKGQWISPSIAKTGTGAIVPDGTWQIDIEYEGLDDYEVV